MPSPRGYATRAIDVVVWDLENGDIDCDISDPDSVSAAIEATVADYGAPDKLVACAGIGAGETLVDQGLDGWRRVLDTNLTGTWLTMRAVARVMIDAGRGGSIVAVSSISGTVADRAMGAYCVSKAGVDMLVRVAASEWGPHGIRVNAVGPGVTRTPMLAPARATAGLGRRPDRTHRPRPPRRGRRRRRGDRRGARNVLGHGQTVFADGGLALPAPSTPTGRCSGSLCRKSLSGSGYPLVGRGQRDPHMLRTGRAVELAGRHQDPALRQPASVSRHGSPRVAQR